DGLAAACEAARRHGADVAYDVEDLHSDVLAASPEWARTRKRILRLEERYVPRTAYVTAVTASIARVLAQRHRIPMPIVVHNCHPWSERNESDRLTRDRVGPELSLYWYSQTIGLNR